MSRALIKRSFTLAGHRTSVALEPAFWDTLERLARGAELSLTRLVASVDAARDAATPLASALRVHALEAAWRHADGSNPDRRLP